MNRPLTLCRKSYMLLLCLLLSLPPAWAQFIAARSGSSMRLHGFADGIDGPWEVQGKVIQGELDVGPNFPAEPGQAVAPGPVVAAGDVYIPVISLQEPGSHAVFYRLAGEQDTRNAQGRGAVEDSFPSDGVGVEGSPPKARIGPTFNSKGDLTVAGVTNKLTMAVRVLPLGDGKLKISGATAVKMSNSKIEPPVLSDLPKTHPLKTHDDVHLSFDWMVAQKPAAVPPSNRRFRLRLCARGKPSFGRANGGGRRLFADSSAWWPPPSITSPFGGSMNHLDNPVLFVATANVESSRAFYERVLGLAFVEDEPYALVFRVGRSILRIQKVDRVSKVPYTVMGWAVRNIRRTVRRLSKAGVAFQRYEGLAQDGRCGMALARWGH